MMRYESSHSNLTDFLREIAEHPLLTAEEEIQRAQQLQEGRRAARRLDTQLAPGERAELEKRVAPLRKPGGSLREQ